MATYLDRILDAHRRRVRDDSRSVDRLREDADGLPPTRGFAAAIRAHESPPGPDLVAVIAEIKRRSPSKGDLFPDLDPANLARQYEVGGAACLSVLTDVDFFGGSPSDLQTARAAVALPALRKDFTVSPQDVVDTRLMGADAVLLIVAALSDSELADFHTLALELGLDALVEVHDEGELERAQAAGATLIGVNRTRPGDVRGRHRSGRPCRSVVPSWCRQGRRVGHRRGRGRGHARRSGLRRRTRR